MDAAWKELTAVGYSALTMEGVAARAGTSRPVIYRRWKTRPELVVAALSRHASVLPVEIPDSGSLREDVLTVMRHMSNRVGEFAAVLSFLILDYFAETGQPPATLRERAIAGTPSAMDAILERAIKRGEINPERLTPRIATLPVDLVRHELLMTQKPVPDDTLVELVDTIFLPLVRKTKR